MEDTIVVEAKTLVETLDNMGKVAGQFFKLESQQREFVRVLKGLLADPTSAEFIAAAKEALAEVES